MCFKTFGPLFQKKRELPWLRIAYLRILRKQMCEIYRNAGVGMISSI